MSKFITDIQTRLAEISARIQSASISERRALQRERADLESKLRKVTA